MESFSELHSICMKVFEAVAHTTAIFILPLFIGRIVFANILGEGSQAFSAIKGVLIYFLLVTGFPLLLEVLFSIPETYLPKYDTISSVGSSSPSWDAGLIPFGLDRILEVILAGLYWVVYYMHVFFMLLMCSMAPVVFLVSTLLGVGLGLEVFMGLLIVGSSWPVIWYGFDQVHSALVSAQGDAFGSKCLELLVTVFKGLAPVAFSSIAIKSPAGRAVTRAAHSSIASGPWAVSRVHQMRVTSKARQRENNYSNSGGEGFSVSAAMSAPNREMNFDRLKKAAKNFRKVRRKNEDSRPRDN